MISCNFNGRLGNNLFQIATAASLANEIGVDLILPELTHAGHRGDIPVDLSMFAYPFNRGKCEIDHEYHESSFEYNSIEPKDKLNLGGFFQSWKYFENIKELLLAKYFTPSLNVLEGLSKYTISDNSLGISVRRGDYLMLQNNHCVLSVEYYQTVLDKYFQNNIDSIYIFSDDIEWCRTIFGNDVNYVSDLIGVQLFLMAEMKHLILSNSTFAWWGAYLNQNNGIVVAPDPWFGPNYLDKDVSDLYYPSWIRFKHDIITHPYTITANMYE